MFLFTHQYFLIYEYLQKPLGILLKFSVFNSHYTDIALTHLSGVMIGRKLTPLLAPLGIDMNTILWTHRSVKLVLR